MTNWETVPQFLIRNKGKISKNTLYTKIWDGSIPSIRLGRRILLPKNAWERMLAQDGVKGE